MGMQASPGSHTLPAALGWKQKFGSLARRRSPARGGKVALTECEAAPLCRPHRTSHLGRVSGEWVEVRNTVHIIIVRVTRAANGTELRPFGRSFPASPRDSRHEDAAQCFPTYLIPPPTRWALLLSPRAASGIKRLRQELNK